MWAMRIYDSSSVMNGHQCACAADGRRWMRLHAQTQVAFFLTYIWALGLYLYSLALHHRRYADCCIMRHRHGMVSAACVCKGA